MPSSQAEKLLAVATHRQLRINENPRTAAGAARVQWRTGLAVVWAALVASIVVLSFLPDTNVAVALVQPVWSDSAHVAVYALLTLITLALLEIRPPISLGVLTMAVVGIALFGGVIEVFQQLAGRTTSLLDGAWNVLGILVGTCGFLGWVRQRGVARNRSDRCRTQGQ